MHVGCHRIALVVVPALWLCGLSPSPTLGVEPARPDARPLFRIRLAPVDAAPRPAKRLRFAARLEGLSKPACRLAWEGGWWEYEWRSVTRIYTAQGERVPHGIEHIPEVFSVTGPKTLRLNFGEV